MKRQASWLAIIFLLGGTAYAQEVELQVELMGPLGTQTSHKGDKLFARVLSPSAFQGDMAEGKVTEVRSGGKIHGQSVLNFTFETLQHGGNAIPIAAQVKSVANSKGQADVDEEGRIIRKSGNVAKVLGGTGLGGLIGGLAGGGKGAVIGAAAGAAASVILIQVAAEGPDIRFDPGSKVTLSAKSRNDTPLTSYTASPAPSATPAVPISAAPGSQTATAKPSAAGPQPDFRVLKDDFIAGEKLLLYDDFTDMQPDEAPPHWKTRGASITLMSAGAIRQITAAQPANLTPLVSDFPQNFTVETDFKFDNYCRSTWYFFTKASTDDVFHIWLEARDQSSLRIVARTREEQLVDSEFPVDLSQPVREAIWVQDGRVRIYFNGQRVVDVNQVKFPELSSARLEVEPSDGAKVSIRRVRIAESTPDFSRSIAASGRYVSHGILFDTDSDCLTKESAAVLKSVARGLEANPNLKLRIEGHTDATGNADHNLDLSRRRAEAVKAVLVSQFGVDASRLTADGLGASKPIDSNDTPQGRAQNRRVEFIRQ